MLSVLVLAFLACQQAKAAAPSLQPEDRQLSLVGRVRLLHTYGPPGWGEDPKHDTRVRYWAIDLPQQITTPCTPDPPTSSECQSTKRLRLVVESDARLLRQARAVNGRKAKVTGILHRADTAGEITPIYMDVIAIKPE